MDEKLDKEMQPPKVLSLEYHKRRFKRPGQSFYDFSKRKLSKRSPKSALNQETHLTNKEIGQSSSLEVNNSESTSKSAPKLTEPIGCAQFEDGIQEEPFLPEVEIYLNLLESEKESVTLADGISFFMVLPDITLEKSLLKKECLILLERKAVMFENRESAWVVMCSCQPAWSRQMSSSSNQYCSSRFDFYNQYPECIHRKVGFKIFKEYDILHNIEPDEHINSVAENESDHTYSTNDQKVIEAAKLNGIPVLRIYSDNEKSYGLVSVLKGKYFCFCCKKNFCGHTKLVRNPSNVENVSPLIIELQEFEKSLKDEKNTSKKKGTCKSYLKVPFKPDLLYSETLKSLPGNLIFVPDEVSCCHCGGELDRGDPVLNEWIAVKDAIVITNTILEKANVYYRPCLNCDTITDFDGLNKCILNMGNYMVGHDVLRSYMHSFLHGRRPLFTFYNVFVDVHEDYGNISIKDEFSYHQFRFAWLSFFDLLDINMTEGFSCPVCERDGGPDTIICDGTSVSFQRRMWTWKELGIQHKTTNQIPRDRIYIADASCRDLLYRFAAGGEVIRGKFTPSLSVDEKDTLKDKLKKYPYLDNFIHSVDDGSTKLKKEFLKFVTSIASKSPVCGYIHPTKDVELLMNELISGMEIKSYPDKWKSLHENIPVLFDIMENTSEKFAPPELRPLLKELLRLSLKPFENCLPCDENEECDDAEEMSFFPSLPQIRKKYTYLMDTTKPKKSCSKTYRGHPSLLPGVFTLFCPHGICYGFQVMPNNESPKIPFNILKTRFKKAPRFVIYDNACALHSYCLNREPEFFKETIFLVDRLHWDNHSGCSCGYRLNLYPELKNLNSQINEQANAGLKRIKDQVSYMTAQNFMNHSSFYLWNKNMKKRSKL